MQQPGGNMYGGQPQYGQNIMSDPMANMAMNYGQNLAGQGRDMVQKNVSVFN